MVLITLVWWAIRFSSSVFSFILVIITRAHSILVLFRSIIDILIWSMLLLVVLLIEILEAMELIERWGLMIKYPFDKAVERMAIHRFSAYKKVGVKGTPGVVKKV